MYTPDDLAIYIHWPFCKSKCPYCDFYKELAHGIDGDKIINEYIEALKCYVDLLPKRKIKSIFFGGGTPSLISPQNIAKLIDFICNKWNICTNIEISLEANPNSNHPNMFKDLHLAGVNRLSLGIQALNEQDLRFLGRTHNLKEAQQSLEEVVKIFNNHSADLIYARPAQTLNNWQKELEEICNYGLKHLSLYQLTIEENTVFARKSIKPLDDDKAADLYSLTRNFLDTFGYKMYEVSNFAQTGFQSRHNLTYWQGGDYIGIGKSAQGRLTLNNNFFATDYPFRNEKLSTEERAEELIFTGLRLTQGIDKHLFHTIIGHDLSDFINNSAQKQLKELNLITETTDFLSATPQGFLVLNALIEQLCL